MELSYFVGLGQCLNDRASIHEARFPASVAIIVVATDVDGKRITVDIESPRGHEKNPMTDQEISDKFRALAEPVIGQARARDALACFWKLGQAASLSAAFDMLVP